MNKKTVFSFFIFVLFAGLLYLIFHFRVDYQEKKLNLIFIQYPEILPDTSIKATITSIYEPLGFKNTRIVLFCELDNGTRVRIPTRYTKDYESKQICDIALLGDSIIKQSYNDTILIIKEISHKEGHLFKFVFNPN